MPIEVKLSEPTTGFAMQTAVEGERVVVQTCGFYSFDDAAQLTRALDGFYGSLAKDIPREARKQPEEIRNIAVVIRPGGAASVWINEIQPRLAGVGRRSIEAGEGVTTDDLADVIAYDLGIEIPPDAGFAYTFMLGWERAFFFDFTPTASGIPRAFDLSARLAAHFTYLLHKRRLNFSDAEWLRLLAEKWFPFILLPQGTVDLMVAMTRAERSVDLVLDDIGRAVEERFGNLAATFAANSLTKDDAPFVETAIERYRAGDFVSAVSVIYPRIEGLLRRIGPLPERRKGAFHTGLAATVIEAGKARLSPVSPLLADRFIEYVTSVFFPDFDPKSPEGLTRHTVTHGVAKPREFTRKGALLGFLIHYQLLYFAPPSSPTAPSQGAGGSLPKEMPEPQ